MCPTLDGETTWYLGSGLEIDEAGEEKISLGAVTYSDGEIWAHNLDHLGTPGYTVSWATGVETFRRFTPFGSPRSNATENAGGASDLTFTGQRDDGSLDLMYYGGRFYDPLVGQFTRPDPLAVDGPNRFAYVRNNPVSRVDPSGLCSEGPPGNGGGECTATNTSRVLASVRSTRGVNYVALGRSSSGGVADAIVDAAIEATQSFEALDRAVISTLNDPGGSVSAVASGARALDADVNRFCAGKAFLSCTATDYVADGARSRYDEHERYGGRTYAVTRAGIDIGGALLGGLSSRLGRKTPNVAPGLAPGVRGLAGAGDELAQGGVYALRDPITGQVVRTGRTTVLPAVLASTCVTLRWLTSSSRSLPAPTYTHSSVASSSSLMMRTRLP